MPGCSSGGRQTFERCRTAWYWRKLVNMPLSVSGVRSPTMANIFSFSSPTPLR